MKKVWTTSTESVELVSTLQSCDMDVQGGADGVKSSQQALLDLERSKVPPVDLLDAVAQILRINYSHIRSTIFDPELSKGIPYPATSCMPKEEWVLRWLLKRVGLSRSGGKSRISNEGCLRYDRDTDGIFDSAYGGSSMRLDGRSWLLFLYLVYHVPCRALARILTEADFVTHLDACLRDEEHTLGLVPVESFDQDFVTLSLFRLGFFLLLGHLDHPFPQARRLRRGRAGSYNLARRRHSLPPWRFSASAAETCARRLHLDDHAVNISHPQRRAWK